MVLTAAMICSSVPVAAENVSESETAMTVGTVAKQKSAETEDTEVENGKEGYLSYRIYQKPDETKYVEITKCDYDAKGAVEIPTKIKNIAVTKIGYEAFKSCRGLTSIEIPEGVTSIGNYAFGGCSGLKDVYYTGTQEQWNAISFGNGGKASDVFVDYDENSGQNISIPFTLHGNSSRPKPSQHQALHHQQCLPRRRKQMCLRLEQL